MKRILLVVIVAALSGGAGWWLARQGGIPRGGGDAASGAERRVLFYQSAMHPWIKSDAPGKCTICGMELTPVYEGDAGFASEAGLVSLSSNSLTVLNVASAPIERGDLVRTLRVAGVIEADETRRRVLSAYVAGRIDELHVRYVGAEVAAGEPLARFYSPMLLEAERQYLAVVGAGVDGDLLSESAALRLRQLGLTEGQIAQLPGKSATNFHTDLVSPIAGTVVNRFVFPGQYVMEGEKLFELSDLSSLWFRFDAYERDLPWLEMGQEVEVSTVSLPGRVFRAPIRFIEPNLREATRSSKVRVELENPVLEADGRRTRLLKNGLYAEGRVRAVVRNALLLPRSAVLSTGSRVVVYVDRGGGAYEQRSVRLGRVGDDAYEVLEGVAEGEPVVLSGNLMIDAQAQLNQAVHGAGHGGETGHLQQGGETAGAAAAMSELTGEQTKAAAALLERADRARAALAGDDLEAYRQARVALPEAAARVRAELETHPDWAGVAGKLGSTLPAEAPADLRSARREFHDWSTPVLELVLALRRTQAGFHGVKVYQCPMTSEAFDGAPRRARWFQMAPPLRNPWFGSEMLDCGTEIQP